VPGKRQTGHKGVEDSSTPLRSLICYYLQPEQKAQQSSEAQHPACASVAVPAIPSAITAINNITFNVFIVFSFRSRKSCREANESIRVRNFQYRWAMRLFLNAEDVRLPENISTRVPKRRYTCAFPRGHKPGYVKVGECQRGKVKIKRRCQAFLLRECGFRRTTRLYMVTILV
jgi:hypothetical protein